MEAEQKSKKRKSFFGTQSKEKLSPSRMAQTPRAGTGDSMS